MTVFTVVIGFAVLIGARPSFGQTARTAVPAPKAAKAGPADAPVFGRQGLWFSAESTSIHCAICAGDLGSRGTAGYARMDTTLNGRLLVGAELNGWLRGSEDGNQRVLALTGNGYWYPNPRRGYYLKGGFGLASYKQWQTDRNTSDVSTGISTGERSDATHFERNTLPDRANVLMLLLGLGVTWH